MTSRKNHNFQFVRDPGLGGNENWETGRRFRGVFDDRPNASSRYALMIRFPMSSDIILGGASARFSTIKTSRWYDFRLISSIEGRGGFDSRRLLGVGG